jgi:hypothetical protein
VRKLLITKLGSNITSILHKHMSTRAGKHSSAFLVEIPIHDTKQDRYYDQWFILTVSYVSTKDLEFTSFNNGIQHKYSASLPGLNV